jgi:hypothetical protein
VSDGETSKKEDVLLVGGPTESGEGCHVLRKRDDQLEVGELRAVREGRPLQGELVRLKPRQESERLFDVDVVMAAPKRPEARSNAGPAQVASDDYRRNWDRVFAKKNALN